MSTELRVISEEAQYPWMDGFDAYVADYVSNPDAGVDSRMYRIGVLPVNRKNAAVDNLQERKEFEDGAFAAASVLVSIELETEDV